MAAKDQLLFGVYVGLVLNSQDPDNLGRAKVIVPGVTGPLFKDWNERDTDISFSSLGGDPFNPTILERMIGVLPWARPASPVWGGGTGAPVNSDTLSPTVIPTDTGLVENSSENAKKNTDNRTINDDGVNNTQGDFSAARPLTGGSSSDGCNTSETGGPIPFQKSTKMAKEQNQKMDVLNQKIVVNNGVMDKSSFLSYAKKRLECSPLLTANLDKQRAEKYGITDTKNTDEWADFMWRTALAEQGGKVAASGADTITDPGGSWGAWSTSVLDTSVYAGYSGKGINDLQSTPELAANTAISMAEVQITRQNSIDGLDHTVTDKGSFAGTTMAALRGERGTLSAQKSGKLVQRTTDQGINAYGSTNMSRYGAPVGSFSIPNAGSKVWVMFENGSPQRPVYVGQVYEPSNIQAHG